MSQDDHKQVDPRRRLEAALRDSLAVAETEGPTADEIESYVDGSMKPDDVVLFDEWLTMDPNLCREVSDLRALREALRHEASPLRGWGAWGGLAAAAGLAGILLWRGAPPAHPKVSSAVTASILTLHDVAHDVVLRADGSVEGLPELPRDCRDAIVAALRGDTVAEPEALASLRGQPGTLMGGSSAALFGVVMPLATFVRSDRPTFRWTPHPRARAYELSVFDEELAKVASVRVPSGTEATLPTVLERGRSYQWQVAALTADGRAVAPAPPQPEARFRVLGAPESAALESDLRAAGDSDLAAGVLLSRAGVRDEAVARLARLAAANPGSVEAARLLEAVRR
jgi:anti-sigma factor RsiW